MPRKVAQRSTGELVYMLHENDRMWQHERVFGAGEDVAEAPLDNVDEDLAKVRQCVQEARYAEPVDGRASR